ncbi:putative alpha-ribazole-5-phosphate synthase CblS for cobalamin biosynthesis [Bacillus thermotolerans]|uniref:Alpha-ribazole-5-phosphate synthase CblS for cobalamin biosynthesis n=1 Tax=Bacillus thermotolerans TaxID=1221996 RepID=A0A0F5I3X4_BACTR|nr:putative alpha-ribazole-5-phosphate synthase CblS for cobalamin biosynthesis [Bacillus thermotolerans]KKB37120.1 putative alpha-ribazole-5-phosphate synthase CblS for cobalamin biosynthesis [Bacillus thermotolerans]KKB40148.1 putative alpha-ribazole-5-phosphate synthase CblS for cobalamin biosynthesis [Bacillus thermotolerans]
MKRDVIYVRDLVVASDNSGSVGEKPNDAVKVPYDTVGYFSARVALMECLAAGGEPFAAIVHNFSGDEAWRGLCQGIQRAADEAACSVEITGSTETNFNMKESATGVVILGDYKRKEKSFDRQAAGYAVIGKPLVGQEVLAERESVVSLQLFRHLLQLDGVYAVQPVGSKGIGYELKQLAGRNGQSRVNMMKSAGPATCFLVAYNPDKEPQIKAACGVLFHEIDMI